MRFLDVYTPPRNVTILENSQCSISDNLVNSGGKNHSSIWFHYVCEGAIRLFKLVKYREHTVIFSFVTKPMRYQTSTITFKKLYTVRQWIGFWLKELYYLNAVSETYVMLSLARFTLFWDLLSSPISSQLTQQNLRQND